MDINSGISLAQSDQRPLYLQIIDHIRTKIAIGDWVAGQQIPSIRALAAELAISVITVKRAYLELERMGLITTRQGKGCFVHHNPEASQDLLQQEYEQQLKKMAELARNLGVSESTLLKNIQQAMEDPCKTPST